MRENAIEQTENKRVGTPGNTIGNRWAKGESGNPAGRPKKDLAAIIATEIFEEHPEVIKKALLRKVRTGNTQMFQALADRAFGKLKEQVEHSGEVGVHVVDRLLSARKRIAGSQDDRERES